MSIVSLDWTVLSNKHDGKLGRNCSNKVTGTKARVMLLRLVSVAQRVRLNFSYAIG